LQDNLGINEVNNWIIKFIDDLLLKYPNLIEFVNKVNFIIPINI